MRKRWMELNNLIMMIPVILPKNND